MSDTTTPPVDLAALRALAQAARDRRDEYPQMTPTEYYAAANPSAVLALLDDNERLRVQLAATEAERADLGLLWDDEYTVLKNIRAELAAERAAHAQTAAALAEAEDTNRIFEEWLNKYWGLLYPDNPTGWEYPGQVFNHIQIELARLAERAAALSAAPDAAP